MTLSGLFVAKSNEMLRKRIIRSMPQENGDSLGNFVV